MKKSTDTLIGISVDKTNAGKKFKTRDTVFKKGSSLNFYTSDSPIGYKVNKRD